MPVTRVLNFLKRHFSILTGSDVTKVKSEPRIVFSGTFYISYQVFIAVPCLEVTVYAEKRDSLDLAKFRPARRAVVLRLAGS